MNCYCIIFVSEATVSLTEPMLLTLLRQARAEHQRAQLTGLLLYSEDRFWQVLEGPEQPLREFFGRIMADPRHGKLQKLADGPKAERDFQDWHMSFACSPAVSSSQLTNYLSLPQVIARVEATSMHHLLREFLAECSVPLH